MGARTTGLGLAFVLLSIAAVVALPRREPEASVAAPSPSPPSPSSSSSEPSPITFRSGQLALRGFVLRPAGPGPFPMVVYNHGSERDPSLEFSGDLGRWFQARGWGVLFPYRRGASGSEGTHWEDAIAGLSASERERATVAQLEAQSDDGLAAIAYARSLAWVDPRAVVVAGCSFGGIEALLTAERAPDLLAALDFAGASYSWAGSAPLRDRLLVAARSAKPPIYFVQAENDFDTTPSRVLGAERQDAGKPHAVKIFPPHGRTTAMGHAHFCNHAMDEWGPDVLAFLADAAKTRGQ